MNCKCTGYRLIRECTEITKRMRWRRRGARCTHTTYRGCLRGPSGANVGRPRVGGDAQ